MQITKNIHALKIPFHLIDPSGRRIDRFVYVYLIYGKKICLIDSGVASGEKVIFDYLRRTGRSPEEISLLILTHSHPDHIGAAYAIKAASGCEIASHAAEKPWIEDVDLQFRERPVPGFKSLVGGSVKVDRILQDGDTIDLDDEINAKVLHTGGHSKGSISILLPNVGVLFSGDAIPISGDLPIYEDAIESVRSIKKLKATEGINHLLAAWDDPQKDGMVCQRMDNGLEYLQHIHKAVIDVSSSHPTIEPMELCRLVLKELGIPEMTANPLVAESFESNLKLRDHKDLLGINAD
ncbi:MAG: MBL fold metallo-hydrolase [Methanotrichaceae archaeon]